VLLVFSDPACAPCAALLPEIARWDRELSDVLTVAVISRGAADLNRARYGGHALKHLLLQRDVDVSAAYGSIGTPAALLVRGDGTIGSVPAGGSSAIRDLVAQFLEEEAGAVRDSPAPAAVVKAGDSAPGFTLPDLDGRLVSLSGLLGQSALIVFWNPGCGYCRRMLRHLREWESLSVDSGPRLLLVSSGGVDENRAAGFRCPVLLDEGFSLGRRYGAQGTPSAVLIDAHGRVAHELVVGAPDILAAVGFRRGSGLPNGAKPRRLDGIEDEVLVDGSMVVYSSAHKRVFTLNRTGALVWDLCDGEQSVAEIVSEIRTVFPSAGDAEGDVRELLDRLLEDGLIEVPSPGMEAGFAPVGASGDAHAGR
jgi:peroxiredoxin